MFKNSYFAELHLSELLYLSILYLFYYCLYVPLPLILRPKEFCLFFASLATAALRVGHSRRGFFSFVIVLLTRAE